jgi:hypothetical protein
MPNYLNDVYTNDRIVFEYYNIRTLQLVKPTFVSELPAVLRAIARKCVSIFRGIYGLFTYNKKLNEANHPVLGENENNEPAQSTHATSYSLKLRALLDPSPIKTKSTPSRTVDALIDAPCRPNTFFAPRSDIADNTSASTLSLRK